jgi:alanyl-tRNA synthetase
LRKELGDDVHQAGSNITPERIRFDFTYPEKVDREILDKVEQYVNEALQSHSNVVCTQMPKEEAREKDVEGSFWEKYPDVVDVYTVGDDVIYSQELCGGPHVENTDEIEGVFKIVKEKSSGAGVRRIKAIVE